MIKINESNRKLFSYSFHKNSNNVSSSHLLSFSNLSHQRLSTKTKLTKKYHNIYLREKLRSHSKIESILSTSISSNNKNHSLHNVFITEPKTNNCTQIQHYNNKHSLPQHSFISSCSFITPNHSLSSLPHLSNNIQSFITNVKLIRKSKMIKAIQTENIKRIQEDKRDILLHVDLYTQQLLQTYHSLERFMLEFNSYVKFLNESVIDNINIKRDLVLYKKELANDVHDLRYKIHLLQKQLSFNKAIKHFLLSVKYHSLNIDEAQHPNNKPIFDSVNEFFESLNDLEQIMEYKFNIENIKKLELTTEREKKKKLLLSFKHSLQLKEQNELEASLQLTNVKHQHTQLTKRYNDLKTLQFVNKNTTDNLKLKLRKLFLALPYNIEKQFHIDNVYKTIHKDDNTCIINGEKRSVVLYYLNILEKVLLYHIEQYNTLNSNLKTKMQITKIKMFLDLHKRINNNKIKMQLEKQRKEQIYNNIITKSNRIIYKPNKKTINYISYNTTNNLKDKKPKNKSLNKQRTFSLEMITY